MCLHLHAFALAAFAVIIAATWLPELGRKLIARPTALWIVCYIPLSCGVYGGRLLPAVGRAAVLAMSYAVVALFVFVVMIRSSCSPTDAIHRSALENAARAHAAGRDRSGRTETGVGDDRLTAARHSSVRAIAASVVPP